MQFELDITQTTSKQWNVIRELWWLLIFSIKPEWGMSFSDQISHFSDFSLFYDPNKLWVALLCTWLEKTALAVYCALHTHNCVSQPNLHRSAFHWTLGPSNVPFSDKNGPHGSTQYRTEGKKFPSERVEISDRSIAVSDKWSWLIGHCWVYNYIQSHFTWETWWC